MRTWTLDTIISTLDTNRQRATYGAVAAVLETTPRSLMKGRAREQSASWIVASGNGLPTGYGEAEMHPELTANQHVIRTGDELRQWLETQRSM
jgi:hypothetical protein